MFSYSLCVAIVFLLPVGAEWGREVVKGSQKILNKSCKDSTGANTTTAIVCLSDITVSLAHSLKGALLWRHGSSAPSTVQKVNPRFFCSLCLHSSLSLPLPFQLSFFPSLFRDLSNHSSHISYVLLQLSSS